MLNKYSIKQKMIFWNIFLVILFASSLAYSGNESIKMLMIEKKTQIKNLTDSIHKIIYQYMKLENEGKITHEQAITGIKNAVNGARYDENNYFFIGDYDSRQITNPRSPEKDGMVQNTPAYKLFHEIALKNKDKEYLSYYTAKAGSTGDYPKLTYLRLIPEWKWFIGTGIYIDDVDKQKSKNILVNGFICIFITTFLMGGGLLLSNFISLPLARVVNLLKLSSKNMEEKSIHLTNMSENVGKSSKNQAGEIQETASSISEVTSMIARTSTLTLNSENLSNTINEQTNLGNAAVKEMVSSMNSIQEASQKLSEIEEIIIQIENKAMVINDIVSKTELLSLNASIESARAGEYGKGFAVVAEEVGNLAKTSGKSSNEIRELLDKSRVNVKSILELTLERVASGESKTTEVSNIFSQIIQNVNEIHVQMTEITKATKEQENGVKQISEAMSKIDVSAIHNLKSAENSIQKSSEILEISSELKNITIKTENIVFGEKIA